MTLIVSRYNYPKLTRVTTPQGRKYALNGQNPVPSVTTIIDSQTDKTHLIEWRKRVGEAEAKTISTQSAGLGTRMHAALERYALGQSDWQVPGNNMGAVLAQNMAEVMIHQGLCKVTELWGVEVPVYSPDLYAGTVDAVGIYADMPSIVDFKTAKKIKPKEWITNYFIQGCLYAEAHNEMLGTDIRQVAILMVDRNEKFQEYVIKDQEYGHYCDLAMQMLASYYNQTL